MPARPFSTVLRFLDNTASVLEDLELHQQAKPSDTVPNVSFIYIDDRQKMCFALLGDDDDSQVTYEEVLVVLNGALAFSENWNDESKVKSAVIDVWIHEGSLYHVASRHLRGITHHHTNMTTKHGEARYETNRPQ